MPFHIGRPGISFGGLPSKLSMEITKTLRWPESTPYLETRILSTDIAARYTKRGTFLLATTRRPTAFTHWEERCLSSMRYATHPPTGRKFLTHTSAQLHTH